MITKELKSQLIKHEGYRDLPYEDSEGIITIGIGHNLEANSVSDDIIQRWFEEDIQRAYTSLVVSFPWMEDVDQVRKEAFVNMVFNLGIYRFKKFKRMLHYAKQATLSRDKGELQSNWDLCAVEALDSKWATQVGQRAVELAEQIRTGLRA